MVRPPRLRLVPSHGAGSILSMWQKCVIIPAALPKEGHQIRFSIRDKSLYCPLECFFHIVMGTPPRQIRTYFKSSEKNLLDESFLTDITESSMFNRFLHHFSEINIHRCNQISKPLYFLLLHVYSGIVLADVVVLFSFIPYSCGNCVT